MVKEYSEFSGISEEEIQINISNFKNLIVSDAQTLGIFGTIVNSNNLIYEFLNYTFNFDKVSLLGKYQLFSPQMLQIIMNSNYKSFSEFMGGLGLLSEIVKITCPYMEVDYTSMNNNISNFAIWRFQKNGISVNVTNDVSKTYDVIVSDGIIQYLNKKDQETLLKNMINRVNKNGIFCLLMDISGSTPENILKQDVDVISLHQILEQSDMVCIYGKNTFSSLWKKMI